MGLVKKKKNPIPSVTTVKSIAESKADGHRQSI
jgi:hypothetical protein